MIRISLLLLCFFVDAALLAQEDERIPAESVAGRMTKMFQGRLQLDSEALGRIDEINQGYAAQIAALRQERQAGVDRLRAVVALLDQWEKNIQAALTREQYARWESMRAGRARELIKAGVSRQTAMLSEALSLDEEQIEQVDGILAESHPRLRALREGGEPQRNKDRQMRAIYLERENAMRNVLNEEQFEIYQRLKTMNQ
jgi:hypothetical protein